MRLTVFGATGRVGGLLVALALSHGHEVTGFARNPRKLRGLADPRFRLVVGELSDREAVERAVAGADAVVSVLGAGVRPRGRQLSEGIGTVLSAMQARGVRRLVVLSTASVPDPLDRPDAAYAALVSAVRVVFRRAYDETVRVGELVRASDLDWTIVRVGLLGNAPEAPVRAGHYGAGEVGVVVSRASLAAYLLQRAELGDSVGESPAVSN